MKIGVIVDGFKKPLPEGLALAAACGFSGVQIYAFSEEFHPGMSEERKKRYKELLSRYHLEVSALCGDVGDGLAGVVAKEAVDLFEVRVRDLFHFNFLSVTLI